MCTIARVDRWLEDLTSPDVEARCEAARALRAMGPAAASAVHALARALRDGAYASHFSDYVTVSECAVDALTAIGAPAVPVLLAALSDDAAFDVPVKCYDQGAYIGDYAHRVVVVRDMAAQALQGLIARDGRYVDLIAELGKTANDRDVGVWVAALRRP